MSQYIHQVSDMIKINQLQFKKKPIIAEFYTEWCPPCKPAMMVIQKQLSQCGGKFLVAKINTDQAEQLNMQYQIQGVPTIILLNNDSSVCQKVIGYDVKKIKQLLQKAKKEANTKK